MGWASGERYGTWFLQMNKVYQGGKTKSRKAEPPTRCRGYRLAHYFLLSLPILRVIVPEPLQLGHVFVIWCGFGYSQGVS